jgi:hypothetical protein
MFDYTFDDEKWNEKKEEVGAWFDANPDYESKRQLVDMLFSVGDVEIGMRPRHWGSITSVFATVPNSPIQKVSNPPNPPIRNRNALATGGGWIGYVPEEVWDEYDGDSADWRGKAEFEREREARICVDHTGGRGCTDQELAEMGYKFSFTCSCCGGDFGSDLEATEYCGECQTCQRCYISTEVSTTPCKDYASIHGRKLSGASPDWAHSVTHYCLECEEKWKARVEERNPEDARLGWVKGLSEMDVYITRGNGEIVSLSGLEILRRLFK